MALIPPNFLDAVVAIGVTVKEAPSWIGTGFLYGIPTKEKDRYQLFLVSNKHVFERKKNVLLRFNSKLDDTSMDFEAPIIAKNGRDLWIGHPDPDVDIGAVFINASVLDNSDRKFSFFESDTTTADRAKLNDLGVTEGDGLFVLGFPMGIVGAERQYVICRTGSIARIQDLLSGANEFLIDALVFPGNSGGPVILKPELTAIEGTKSQKRAQLIGIVHSYLPYEEIAISLQTGRERIRFQENSGLASVAPVDLIHETVKLASKRFKARQATQKSRAKKPIKRTAMSKEG